MSENTTTFSTPRTDVAAAPALPALLPLSPSSGIPGEGWGGGSCQERRIGRSLPLSINLEIHRQVEIASTPRVQQLQGLFDIPPAPRSQHHWHHRFTLPDSWNIGVIVGHSGSGKTTLARELFGDAIRERWPWPADKSLLDGFPPSMGIKEITGLLCSVGFSSPPAWLRPFAALSNGEQFRVTLARTLAEMPDANAKGSVIPGEASAIAVVDEFTSVVDRTAARIGSAAVAKAVRRSNREFVAVTCHYDVLDWLEPDWVYEPHTGDFRLNNNLHAPTARGRLWRRPPIQLEILRVHSSMWKIFRPHHYLSAKLHRSARCFLAAARLADDAAPAQPAAFIAALPFPHPHRPGWREHRCVCLPDYQGVGIGNALSEFVAQLFVSLGKPYFSTTSHPAMIQHRLKSTHWRMRRTPSLCGRHRGLDGHWRGSPNRLTAGFEYVGLR
jgi:hypothetical protein